MWERLPAAIIAAGCRSHRSNRVLQNKHQAASQALTTCRGRDYVLPDDVKSLAPAMLPHRLVLSSEARLRGRNVDDIVAEVMAEVAVPIEG